MGIKRDIVCTICGLTACGCANAGTFVEAVHPHQRALRAAITREVDALPPEPDHTHQDYDRAVRVVDTSIGVTTSSGELPPGRFVRGAEPRRRTHYQDASFVFGSPQVLLASASGERPPGRFI